VNTVIQNTETSLKTYVYNDLPKYCKWTLIWWVRPVTGLPIVKHTHTPHTYTQSHKSNQNSSAAHH